MVSTETLTTVILDALPSEKYSVIKQQAIRDPDLSVERMFCLMRTIHVNDVETSSRESSPERRENIRDSAMNTISGFKGFFVTIAERGGIRFLKVVLWS